MQAVHWLMWCTPVSERTQATSTAIHGLPCCTPCIQCLISGCHVMHLPRLLWCCCLMGALWNCADWQMYVCPLNITSPPGTPACKNLPTSNVHQTTSTLQC